MDTVNGADLCTLAAARTLGVVDYCKVIHYVDSIVRTILLALAAGYTSIDASLSCVSTLCVARAFNDYARDVGDEVNYRAGAGTGAYAAADTLLGVNLCHAAINADSALGTNACTVAKAKAGESAELVAGIDESCGAAGLVTLEIKLCLCCAASSVAGNVSNLLNNVSCLKTHNRCDCTRGAVTAGNAEAGIFALTVCKRLCISVASAVSAGTAVGTGKAVTNGGFFFVNGHTEILVGYRKKHGTKRCNSGKDKNGN